MKRLSKTAIALTVLILMPLAMAASSPNESTETVFQTATSLACAQKTMQCQLLGVSREELGHDLVYYRALIKIDSGDYDVIALNRVVLEHGHGVQPPTAGSLFFIHGSSGTFRMLMVAPHGGNGLGVFLGKRHIDVWGIDLRNVQIPADAGQLPDAHSWGLDMQIKDVRLATRIARWARALSGQGTDRLILSGHSAGATVAYAVVNAEAAIPLAHRDIAGLIPIDMVYKLPTSATAQIQQACASATTNKANNDAGRYFSSNVGAIAMAKLAQTDPDEVSPFGSPLTNQQYLLKQASALSFPSAYAFHRWAVVRDESGVATEGSYTPAAEIAETIANQPPYPIPSALVADMFSPPCTSMDTPYDDNLGEIEIPVLYIGQAGGFGAFGEYTPDLLGSRDVTKLMIQFRPDNDAVNDFGHMEAFTAEDAEPLAWEPMRKWIVDHQRY